MNKQPASPLKVLLASAEVAPFAKAGGLADVAGALPKALSKSGVDARIVMPAYPMVIDRPDWNVSSPIAHFAVEERPGCIIETVVYEAALPGSDPVVPVYLIGPANRKAGNPYFEHASSNATIYAMEPSPYVYFDRAVLAWLEQAASWVPDILHANDWHCGLIPYFAKTCVSHPKLSNIKYLFTIHNLAYQGDFGRDLWWSVGLNDSHYTIDGLECYGRWSFMKGALNSADYANTVSPNYAAEILTAEYGNGLDGLLHKLDIHSQLSGILNGIDTDVFNPAVDPFIPANYSVGDPANKSVCKAALQRELGLAQDEDALIIGMVTRFVEQKGLDLFHAEVAQLLGQPVQFAMLGLGDPRYEQFLLGLQATNPGRVAVRVEYNAALAQRIYAGSDLFLMPSRFEPCGLGQLIALRYGSIPIVRATGGLEDTIVDYNDDRTRGNGFKFAQYSGEAFTAAVARAVKAMGSAGTRSTLVRRAMAQDWSWSKSASKYVSLYNQIVSG